nr:xin actin-binding repeat-containing protein 1 [Anolis sagrei ordinatus]XP_060638612.1 xin actin-binding repeat-containing protein 1 [Anolis sagrei ordinatus]
MAEAQNDMNPTSIIRKIDENMPPPPPPPSQDSAPGATSVARSQNSSPLPPPPPKETFSKFYQQRQVNELKRLYRHMHPELRKNLEEAVTEDLAEMLSTDDPNAQASMNLDAVLPGEVQSMRWIFENWTLDSIGEHQAAKKLAEEEAIPSGDVKNRSMRFESPLPNGDGPSTKVSEAEQTKGDVRTARWLFETQPLDALNKMYLDETDLQEAVLKEPVEKGDVKGAAQLFETHSLDALGRCCSVEEQSILQLKSEIQEHKGDVKKTIKLFQTEPLCAIRDQTGHIHEIKSVCREEIQSNTVKTARWLFETQPLDTINKDTSKVQVIRGISLEESSKGNVSGAKWLFETQPLDAIREITVEETDFKASPDLIQGADVSKQCLLFETQPLDALKGEPSNSIPTREEVVKGDVKSSLWLFETQPMETLRDSYEVGHLMKVELTDEEKGAVKQTKHVFETCPLGSIAKSPAGDISATNIQEVEKGDVKAFKSLFETLPLDSIRQVSSEEMVEKSEEIPLGNVKANQTLFETTPLYAIKDCFGNFHKVTSVSREEEVTSGDVKNYKWMFETKPLDQFDDSAQKVALVRGITKQEVVAGDVKTAKWLFETQPIDVIHSQMNPADQNISEKGDTTQKGDVKTCRWLFETHPMDTLYEKEGKKQDGEELVPQGDVKSCTWMFETRPLDSLKGQEEQYLQVCKVYNQDELQGVDVKTVRHLFETEPLVSDTTSSGDTKKIIRYSSRVEIQSGEVSRVKEFFEAKPLDSMHKLSIDKKVTESPAHGDIERGAVHKFTWLFENCPMDTLKSSMEGIQEVAPQKDIQGGDVGAKKFVFETYSLDQIHDKENEMQIKKIQEETMNKADIKSCTMLFETRPLYAIQDKEGEYHEVTSVKKEEIMKGDVKGARWQFETKPLDQIKKDEEVFVIRAVTQEDFKKGDVQAARWRFETEPLDSIVEEKRPVLKTIDDVQKGDVQSNKQLFESEQVSQKKYVRMVSVSDVQHGDVRTSTWLFENQPIDSLKGESESNSSLSTVQREDIHKGDVKRCTWLFETQPMDSLKDQETSASVETLQVAPQADVKSTTWLFESTPLDKLSTSQYCAEKDATQRTITSTLEVLFSHQVIQHDGILIEASDTESITMAKYHLGPHGSPEVQKEEVMGGNLQNILMQLLQRSNIEASGELVQEEVNGEVRVRPVQLLDTGKAEKSKENLKDDVSKALQELLSQDISIKKGLLMQETETGSAKITIFSLLHHFAQEHSLIKGDVKSTIGNLLASSQEQKATATIRREDNEKGNVQLYTSCIEKGDLDYLKNLQRESEIESLASSQVQEEPMETVQQAKVPAQLPEGKLVPQMADVVLGDISGTKQVILCKSKEGTLEREADLGSTEHCLAQSLKPVIVEGNQVPRQVKFPIESVQKTQDNSNSVVIEDRIVLGKREEGTATAKVTEQTIVTSGATHSSLVGTVDHSQTPALGSDLQAAMQSLRLATAEAQSLRHQFQSKLQKTTEEIQQPTQTATVQVAGCHKGCVATSHQQAGNAIFLSVQEMPKSQKIMPQKSMAPYPKVSASEQDGVLPFAALKDEPSAELSIKDGLYTAKPVKSYVNPFAESDYKEHSVPEEREQEPIIGGDVQTAIRALQSAATGQRPIDKEDVVRGNLKATLESLEKSNVNVSKGDFKAAMIYRQAGQSYSICKKKNETQILSNQAAAVEASGSQAINDCPPPPPASVMGTECQPTKQKEVKTVRCSSLAQPYVPKALPPAPTKPSDQKAIEKPQLPPKPGVIAPPRRKPVPPPKPEFLLKEALPQPASFKKGSLGIETAQLSSPKPLLEVEQSKSKTLPIPDFAKAACGAEIWEPPTCQPYSAAVPVAPSSVSTAIEDLRSEKNPRRDMVKTPLQVAEEKYKAKKEEQSKVELAGQKLSVEAVKMRSEGESCYLTKETEGFLTFCQPESGGAITNTQGSPLSLGFQTDLMSLDGPRKPYLSAKCHANILKKGAITTHNTSSETDDLSIPRAAGSMDNQTTSPRLEMLEPAFLASSSFQSKPFLEDPQFVHNKGLRGPERTSEQNAEERQNPVVIMREKPCRETEDERRKRLSVHKEEIMKGNVKEAMEIFENLRRQEALQEILTRVKEFEEETSKVDVKSLKNFFENVPDWVVYHKTHQTQEPKAEKVEQMKDVKEDTDSVSSVELAFEDLERASAEIIHLKEQTLSRLLDIEEAIRKALCSISSLKSESDIAGLSGLLKESLGNSQSLAGGNNIRKISIVSSKAKQDRGTQHSGWDGAKGAEKQEAPKLELEVPHIIQPRASSPSSPSYISIQSAARKTGDSPQTSRSPSAQYTRGKEVSAQDIFSSLPRKSVRSDDCNLAFCEDEYAPVQMQKGTGLIKQQHLSSPEVLHRHVGTNSDKEQDVSQNFIQGAGPEYASKASLSALSPSNPRRQKSILELQTNHDGSKLFGATRTVTEQYEEVDEFGNKIITSSTTVTKQSETQTSSTCDMVSCPTRYEVTASPVLRRYLNSPADFPSNEGHQEAGVVFVTFSNSKPAKK